MIKKLKKKMLITIMTFVTLILFGLALAINLFPVLQSNREAKRFLEEAVIEFNNGMDIPDANEMGLQKGQQKRKGRQNPYEDNMFSPANIAKAEFDVNNELVRWEIMRKDLYDESYIEEVNAEISNKIHNQAYMFGTYDSNYYLYQRIGNSHILVLMENQVAFKNTRNTLIISIVFTVCAWGLLLLLSIWMVNRMTQPIGTAFEKQRQFISDAGHELKTPVAVISANADVLESEIGENKWLGYIRTEVERMNKMIQNLMMLAQIDDGSRKYVHTDVNLSQIVTGAALPFESLAFEKQKNLEINIVPNLWVNGNKELLEQLVTILLSNAVKYSNEHGKIKIDLKKSNKKAQIIVYNTGDGIREEDQDKIFERFYRVDKDRSRKSGHYGLGLAIARSIADEHHGSIHVQSKYGEYIEFLVELDLKEKREQKC